MRSGGSMAGQSQKKFERLKQKAEELFLTYGYGGVSVDQIASEAGISKMTVYKHFHSKEDLLVDVLKDYIDRIFKVIMEKVNEKYHTVDKIEAIYSCSLQEAQKFPPVLTRDVFKYPNIMDRVGKYKIKIVKEMWKTILEDGIKKGEIRQMDVDFVCELLMGLPYAFVDTDYFKDEAGISELILKMYDFMMYGMLGRADSRQHQGSGEVVMDGEKCTHEDTKC